MKTGKICENLEPPEKGGMFAQTGSKLPEIIGKKQGTVEIIDLIYKGLGRIRNVEFRIQKWKSLT